MNAELLDILRLPAVKAAPLLLGCVLEREVEGQTVRVMIVETEAYDQSDAASHSYKGITPRSEVMFGAAGHLYVYFTYGMHYCANIVTGGEGEGAAVLIRAVEPLDGVAILERRRHKIGPETTNGPAKLCQALGIDRTMNGHDLSKPPFVLKSGPYVDRRDIVQTTRIGISQERYRPWRFFIKDNPYVSRRTDKAV